MLLKEVYQQARVINSGAFSTTVNELCDQSPALRPKLLWEVAVDVARRCPPGVTKLLSEEDKGAPILAAASLVTGIPMCMARWYPYQIEGQQAVEMSSEYFSGTLYLNGVEKGDRVCLIEDTISTGGTMIALIQAVRAAGGEVVGAVAAVEKVDNKGVGTVREQTGVEVKTILKISIRDGRVVIVD